MDVNNFKKVIKIETKYKINEIDIFCVITQ